MKTLRYLLFWPAVCALALMACDGEAPASQVAPPPEVETTPPSPAPEPQTLAEQLPAPTRAFTVELGRERAAGIEEGARVDVLGRFELARLADEERERLVGLIATGEDEAAAPEHVAMLLARDVRVMRRHCGDGECALVLALAPAEAMTLRALELYGELVFAPRREDAERRSCDHRDVVGDLPIFESKAWLYAAHQLRHDEVDVDPEGEGAPRVTEPRAEHLAVRLEWWRPRQVLDELEPGDRVDILGSFDGEVLRGEGRPSYAPRVAINPGEGASPDARVTVSLLQGVVVLSHDADQELPEGAPHTITLELSLREAELLLLAQEQQRMPWQRAPTLDFLLRPVGVKAGRGGFKRSHEVLFQGIELVQCDE